MGVLLKKTLAFCCVSSDASLALMFRRVPCSEIEPASSSSSSTASPAVHTVTALLAKGIVVSAVRSMFGIVGAARWQLDLLEWDERTATGILATDRVAAVPVRGALTLCGAFEQLACRIQVVASSAFLLSLSHTEGVR